MTEDEAKQHTVESANALPWDYPGFIICLGRYYYTMGLIDIGPSPVWMKFGGDMTFLLWRFENNPNESYFTYRFRYNAGVNTSPWDYSEKGDRKSWHAMHGPAFGARGEPVAAIIRDGIMALINTLGQVMPGGLGAPDWLPINGDSEKFFKEVVRQKKPWMHLKAGPALKKK